MEACVSSGECEDMHAPPSAMSKLDMIICDSHLSFKTPQIVHRTVLVCVLTRIFLRIVTEPNPNLAAVLFFSSRLRSDTSKC